MLVDKMEYQGQQGGGEVRFNTSHELLPSTAVANDKMLQHYQQQFGQQQFDARSDVRLPNQKFQSNPSSCGGVGSGDGCAATSSNSVVCGESISSRRKRNCRSCNCSCSGADHEVVRPRFDAGDGVNDWAHWSAGVFDLAFGAEGTTWCAGSSQ
ncbi:uncharacterized protein [Physcomitrium patens]|uniref:uncharacterized protein n=1 Tax=Physcomitrium patens TaxID=3218 RepID=UPI00024AFADF|nr:uncharacterized protein LOC112284788 [Physcomitrium patens]|eukprot:XP_024380790.1 uncharacterized protein LOC112284788 [Physcomitrella patens]